MRAYVIRRLLLSVPTLLLVTLIVFMTVRFIPGDVIDMMMVQMQEASGLGSELTEEYLREALGLNEPLMVQYGRWLGVVPQKTGEYRGILQGDLGESLWRR
jgi:peptide/nickel transport system permease protein